MLHDSPNEWFDRASAEWLPPASERSISLPPPVRAGSPFWAALGGAVAGAAGGIVLLVVCHSGWATQPATAALAVIAGAVLGAAFGRVTRRLLRVVPRVVVGGTFFGAVGILVYAFVLSRLAPHTVEALPFVRAMLGAMAYGACAGVVPPLRARLEYGRRV